MANEEEYGRRKYDRPLIRLEVQMEDVLEKVSELEKVVFGDPVRREDGIEPRIRQTEKLGAELKTILEGYPGTKQKGIKGDLSDLLARIVLLDGKLDDIAKSKDLKVTIRRDKLTFISAIAVGAMGMLGFLLTNVDKLTYGVAEVIQAVHPDKTVYAERIRRQIVEAQSDPNQGPEVRQRLKRLEAQAEKLKGVNE